jgi:phosphatidylserine synthase
MVLAKQTWSAGVTTGHQSLFFSRDSSKSSCQFLFVVCGMATFAKFSMSTQTIATQFSIAHMV